MVSNKSPLFKNNKAITDITQASTVFITSYFVFLLNIASALLSSLRTRFYDIPDKTPHEIVWSAR